MGCETPLGKTVDRVIRKALDKASCIVVFWWSASVDADTCAEDLAELARGGSSLAASYGESVESTTGVKATELLKWLEESLGGSEAAEPGGQVDVRREPR